MKRFGSSQLTGARDGGLRSELALASVLAPGALGMFVVARTAAYYAGQDSGALLLVLAMGAGLALGLAELVGRVRRSVALDAELSGLAPQLEEAQLNKLSPSLRQLFWARIEHAPLARSESITPYLVGLMVMLGLLGTLLGLFETLGGAGHALTASNNIEALRGGLSGPMRGLTRSFGCSAAGVSASAMLGLAAAIVRKRESAVLQRVQSYANEALRGLSPHRSQAETLARLSEQGASMPAAAAALTRVAEQLNGLSERWEAAHARAAEAQQKSIENAFAHLHGEVTKAAGEAGRSLQKVLTTQLEQLLQKTRDSVAQHAQETGRTLDRELLARRESDALLRKGLSDELSALQAGLAESRASETALVAGQVERLEASLTRCAAQQAEQLSQQSLLVNEHMGTLAHASRALSERLEQDARARQDDAARLFDTVGAQLSKVGGELGSVAEAVSAQLTTRMDQEHSLVERTREAMALIENHGRALGEALTRQERAVEGLLSGARENLAASADQAQGEARAALAQVVALAGDQAERLVQLEQKLEAAQAAQAGVLSHELSSHAERLSQGLTGTSGVVQEAAELLKASSVELSAVAEMFAKSVERQREAASTWLESLGELEGAVERVGRGAAADALGDQLASTQEVFARQLQFQRELFEQLRMLRAHTPAATPSVHGEHDVSA
jgi:hypothetical protein